MSQSTVKQHKGFGCSICGTKAVKKVLFTPGREEIFGMCLTPITTGAVMVPASYVICIKCMLALRTAIRKELGIYVEGEEKIEDKNGKETNDKEP